VDEENRRLAGQMIEAIRQVAAEHDFHLETTTDRDGAKDYAVTVKLVRPNGGPPRPLADQGELPLADQVIATVREGLGDAATTFAAPRAHRRGAQEER